MFIYIIVMFLILSIGLFFNVNKSYKLGKYYLIFIFSILTLLSALRNISVGVDTSQYYEAYKLIGTIEWNELDKLRYEIGFSLLCKVLNYISSNPQLLLIVTSIFINSSVGLFIYRNSNNVVLSSFIFITYNLYFNYMNIMRQAIAIAIVLFAYEYLKNKKIIKYSILVLIASLFHTSSIICLLFIIFSKVKYDKKITIFIFGATGVGFIFYDKLYKIIVAIFQVYNGYIDGKFGVSNYFGAALESLILICILVMGLYILSKFKKMYQKDENEFDKINILAWLISMAMIFSVMTMRINIFNRITSYFLVFVIIWIPEVLDSITIAQERVLYKYIVCIMLFCYCMVILYFRPQWTGVIPYRVFF